MSPLKLESTSQPSGVVVRLTGDINEDSTFAPVAIEENQEASFDLGGVTSLNSCGIREWIRWVKDFPSGAKLVFSNCPKAVVDQMNMVDGFLPKGARVQSFMVPYYCEDCKKLKSVLFSEGREFTGAALNAPEQVPCDQCRKPAEMDVIETKYFKFLRAHQK